MTGTTEPGDSGLEAGRDGERSLLLLELSRTVTSTLDLQEVLDKTLAALRRLLDFGGGGIQLVENGHLVPKALDPTPPPEVWSVRIPVGQGVSGSIAATGQPIYIPDVPHDKRVSAAARKRGVAADVRTYFGLPLIIHGEVVGVVQFDAPRVDAFSPQDRATVLAFLPTVAAAVQNAQLFEQEIQTLAELREAKRMKDDFVSVISHELRTPLTTILGFADTLAHHAEKFDGAAVADFSRQIVAAGHRLALLIEDLLDLSQMGHGGLRASRKPTDLAAIVDELVTEEWDGGHPVALALDRTVGAALADGDRVRQVLSNLMSNARKFSDAGDTIHVKLDQEDDSIVLRVEDHGKGIPPDLLDKVFDAFYQVEPAATRSAGGLGVGLYLVRHLCELMGAEVGVDSKPGEGSTFWVRFQAAPS
jgi:signal transduction histidine kinase